MPDRLPGLADARRAHGLSQRQVAHALGVHQRTISRLERGEIHGITAEFVDRYTAHLGALSTPPAAPVRRPGRHAGRDVGAVPGDLDTAAQPSAVTDPRCARP